MCGLFASLGFEPSPALIAAVDHRGPDQSGAYRAQTGAGPLSLLFRRLAIYDVSTAASQPMTCASERFTIVFNGAIYNFRDLREELSALGHSFKTQSDTEVILASLAQWDIAALARFNGIFAGVVFDRGRQRLIVFRDRFGVKPLYCWQEGERLAFASEIKQLLAIPGMDRRADREQIAMFLAHGLTDHGAQTCFRAIRQVPAGHAVVLELAGQAPLPKVLPFSAWYRLPVATGHPGTAEEASERVRAAFIRAIKLQSVADVPVGSCLSGGIDSSAIVGAVQAQGIQTQHAVSAVFPGQSIDESRFVDHVATASPRLRVHRISPEPEKLLADLDRVLWHQEQPFASTSILAQWSVFEEARRQGLTVMLDGQGADELFAGYPPMLGAHMLGSLRSGSLMRLVREAVAIRRHHGYGFSRQMLWLMAALAPSGLTRQARGVLRREGMARWLGEAPDWPVAPRESGLNPMDRLVRQSLSVTSLPMLLRFEDRNSMAHAIEARVPFLDHDLVETVLAEGGAYNFRNGETKWLEREALSPLLPTPIRQRRDKIGFATPESRWLTSHFRPILGEGIELALAIFSPMLEADAVRRDLAALDAGVRPYRGDFWRLAVAGLWARRFGVTL